MLKVEVTDQLKVLQKSSKETLQCLHGRNVILATLQLSSVTTQGCLLLSATLCSEADPVAFDE